MPALSLPYGHKLIDFYIPEHNLLGIIEQQNTLPVSSPLEAIIDSLNSPIASPKLGELVSLKNPQKIVIVVNDITRPTPYNYMLPPLIETLARAGIADSQITLVVATGIHRPNTVAENEQAYTKAITERFKIINHNPDAGLQYVGQLRDGQRLLINAEVAQADLLITTGLINLHYFAGYSGGRKSILPGVAARELITYNHSRMNEPGCSSGSVDDNPVHHTMLEAARLVNVDFMLNVVVNDNKQIVEVVSGDIEQAWLEGVRRCQKLFTYPLGQKADVVIASAGGYPKDINVYQAQKAIEHAAQAVKPGGAIVLCASCSEGYGEDTFEQWMNRAASWPDIVARFHQKFELGGHKAFALARSLADKQLILISDLAEPVVKNLLMTPAQSAAEALNLIHNQYGPNWSGYIMPNASGVLPVKEVSYE